MGEPNWDALMKRHTEVDSLIATVPDGTEYADLIQNLRIEKTIILSAQAIVEAIWKARY